MKYLISPKTAVVNLNQSTDWGVDRILTLNAGDDIYSLFLQDKEAVIFVPTVSDYNMSLSYQGVNEALRILMRYLRNKRTDVNLVLMGNETKENFLLHYDYPNVLKIPGVDYIRFNKYVVAAYKVPSRRPITPTEYIPYLNSLGLKFPSSFKSTHSLTNEWCLYKWNSFMGFDSDSSALKDYLYFEYLITLEKLNQVKNKAASDDLKKRIQNLPASRILIIDDRVGWHKFFNDFFEQSHNVEVKCLGADFNKLKLDDIVAKIRYEISEFKPEVIILDFRLMEDRDAEITGNMKEISGYKVLSDVIKGNFKSPKPFCVCQVIVFTATGRIENILMLHKGNADGFIFKEKPEQYNGKEITKDVISHMVGTMGTAIERAKFLIPLNENLTNLSALVEDKKSRETDLCSAIDTAVKSVRQLTQNNEKLDSDVLKLAFLNLFSILEALKEDNSSIDIFIKASKYALDTYSRQLWDDIPSIRNCLAHGDSTIGGSGKLKGKDVSVEILKEWTINLTYFLLQFLRLHLKK